MGEATPWDRWVWAAVVGAILSAAMVVFSNPAADTDLWGHLLFGLDKLERWHAARVDSYSFTAEGLPWVNHEWLSEVIGAAVWKAAGDRGLLAGKILLGLLIGGWLVVECRRRGASALAVAVVGLSSVYGLWPGTMFRPQLFSYLMFAVMLSLLSRITDGRRRLAALLPVVMAVWANLHGGFVVGLGALAIVSAWQLVRWLAGRDSFQESWPLLAAAAIALSGGRIFVDPRAFSVAAIRFLDAQDAGGRLVLPFEWGEYELWHLSPEWKVSFDGRFETVYPEAVREAHFQAAIDPARWEDLADRWRADSLLAPAVPAVVEIADRRPEDWKLVWRDPTAVVLVRNDGTMAAVSRQSRPTTDERPLTAFP